MKTQATKENTENWLINNRLESIKNQVACQTFLRGFGKCLLFALSLFLPILITVYTGYFIFLLLILPLSFFCWKFTQWKGTFVPK